MFLVSLAQVRTVLDIFTMTQQISQSSLGEAKVTAQKAIPVVGEAFYGPLQKTTTIINTHQRRQNKVSPDCWLKKIIDSYWFVWKLYLAISWDNHRKYNYSFEIHFWINPKSIGNYIQQAIQCMFLVTRHRLVAENWAPGIFTVFNIHICYVNVAWTGEIPFLWV